MVFQQNDNFRRCHVRKIVNFNNSSNFVTAMLHFYFKSSDLVIFQFDDADKTSVKYHVNTCYQRYARKAERLEQWKQEVPSQSISEEEN